ncbi:Acid phosphatase/vanadium-dependent haloperoxidase-related protein, putative isoform 2 [Theobroma cacao]|uniref:Acid phosphatase/vanadium-dependent haloperoxidase-related protein, putative isoform 2 n=1 Tax=Theobroma cacao TaxID=3641 RepID=A0A061FBP5_THECC|nr:Acid phosphatase/vanadium-dependent haloperoxidase-related protein, putative isoform 2 [Theobroma cacao]
MALQCWTSHALFLTFTQPKNHGRIHDVIRIPRKAPKFTCLVNIGLADIAEVAHNKVLVAAAVSAAIGQLSKPVTSVILYGKDFNFRTAFQAGGFPSTHSSVMHLLPCFLFGNTNHSLLEFLSHPFLPLRFYPHLCMDSLSWLLQLLLLSKGVSLIRFSGSPWSMLALSCMMLRGVRREVGNHAKALNTVLPKGQVTSVVSKNRDDLIVSRDESVATLNVERLGSLVITSDKEVSQTNEAVASSELAADDEGSESNAYKPLIPLKESIGHTEVEVVAGALLGFLVSLAVYSIM